VASSLKTSPRSDQGRIRGSWAPHFDNGLTTNAESQQNKSSWGLDRSRYVQDVDGEGPGDQVTNEKDLRRLEKYRASSTNIPAQDKFNASPGNLNEQPSKEKLHVNDMLPQFGKWN
jgi:hypothetical protein